LEKYGSLNIRIEQSETLGAEGRETKLHGRAVKTCCVNHTLGCNVGKGHALINKNIYSLFNDFCSPNCNMLVSFNVQGSVHRKYIPFDIFPRCNITQFIYLYGPIRDTMTLLKPIHKMSMVTPYEQLFIQTFHHNGNLITEQGTGEQNPLFQLATNTVLPSAIAPKQINTIPTSHSNQFQLFHNRGR
jgi:hypothetical protein